MRKIYMRLQTYCLTRLRATTRERLKPHKSIESFARIALVETATARRLLVVAAAALAAKGRIETCSG